MVRTATCPICQKPLAKADGTSSEHIPFCSKRCQQADLYRWFAGKYAIVEDLDPERLANEMFQAENQNDTGE